MSCEELADLLPDQVLSQSARATSPESDLTKAWGDPAIILRCGVDTPIELSATSQLVTVNNVDWFPQELTAGYRFTTTGREANVEVSVPGAYAPEAGALVDLARPITEAVAVATAEE